MPDWLARILQSCLDFSNVLNTSIAAGWLVMVILVLRVLLRRCPKAFHVALWGMVALRLLIPALPESTFSLIPSAQTIPQELLGFEGTHLQANAHLDLISNQLFSAPVTVELSHSVDYLQWKMIWMIFIWLPGILLLLLYAVWSSWRLHRRVRTAVRLRDHLYQSEFVTSPFVLGVIRPRIYLPFSIDPAALDAVIAHEQAHIARKDHWWKLLGYLLLSVHWFNPLMWLAYLLLCRDIEQACDQRVIRMMEPARRADYAQSLLHFSTGSRSLTLCPLAFGEVDVKRRIDAILHYRKPTVITLAAALVVCICTAAAFLTNPVPSVRNPWVQEYLPGQGNILGSVNTEDYLRRSPDFAIGADRYGRAVFKDPHAAMAALQALYADGISQIQSDHQLPVLSQASCNLYKIYGWQTTSGSPDVQAQAAFVSKFLDIYENSFSLEIPNTELPEPTREAAE